EEGRRPCGGESRGDLLGDKARFAHPCEHQAALHRDHGLRPALDQPGVPATLEIVQRRQRGPEDAGTRIRRWTSSRTVFLRRTRGFHPAMLPALLPLFPLPRVVLFPHTFLPLHIFEPRYRQMTAECLATHQHFILALTRAHEGS